jgi:uncharacterized membrane protein
MPSVGSLELVVILLIWLFFIGIVVATFRLVRRGARATDPAMDALRTRLARGEIDEAEYLRLKAVLQGH